MALFAFARWGWTAFGDGVQWAAAIMAPLALTAAWGTFNVAGDPSRSGGAPVPVPGRIRLGLEIAFFALGAWALALAGPSPAGWIFAAIVAGHYGLSWDRIAWLLRR